MKLFIVIVVSAMLLTGCATQSVMSKKTDQQLIEMYNSRSYYTSVPVDILLTCGAFTTRNAIDRKNLSKELYKRCWVHTPRGWEKLRGCVPPRPTK